MRFSPSLQRAARALMLISVPWGRDWMRTAMPTAVQLRWGCWARWLPTTVKRSVWGMVMWMTPEVGEVREPPPGRG
ncbi:hypothetical protein SBADM41S_10440 [Streptomyces badius]